MGFSPFLNECQAEGYWPIGPACDKIFSFGIYLFFSVVNFIILSLSNVETSNYTRIDSSLSIHIILAICSVFAVICQSIFYLVIDFFFNSYSPLILAFCISKLTFWLICLASLAKYRSVKINMAISLSTATVLSLVPMTAWHKHFPPKQSNKIDFVFYIIELVLVVAVFTFSMITPLLSKRNQNSQSAWTNFSRKLVMVAPYVWPKKSMLLQLRVVICFLLLIIGRLINVALPVYSKWIIDDLSTPDQFHYSLIFIATGLKFLQGSGSMGGFLNTLRTFLWIPIQQYTTRELEVELFSHLHSLSMRWHLSRKTGQVLRVMDRGTSSINNILNYILFNVVPTIADIFIAVIFFLSNFNFYFGCIIFITMAIYMGVTIWITEWRTKFLRESNEKDNSISALATDSLLNYETVKYYGNEDYEVNRFRESIESFQILAWKSQASLGLLNFLQNGIIGIGLALGSFFIVYLVTVEKTLTIGDYVLFTTYILQLYTPLNFFGTIYRVVQKSFVDMENMFDLMSEEVEVKDLPNAIEYKPTEGKITVRNMSFEYNPNQPVLKNISFEISTGQTVAFVGPSGSGKSTIIRLLFRLFDPVDGDIEFDNIKVNEMTIKSLRKQIGIVPQDTVLFNDTIKYNIRFGRTDATDEEVIEAAKAAMIHEKIISLPEGYDTLVGERGLRLSGGEKQRVAIARTILKKPQFIFLDEATSALDTHTEKAIQKCLEKLCKTKTGVVVAHRLSTIVNADLIVVLEKGEILEAGNHRQLLEKKGTYASMWEAQITEQKEKSIDIISPSSSPIP